MPRQLWCQGQAAPRPPFTVPVGALSTGLQLPGPPLEKHCQTGARGILPPRPVLLAFLPSFRLSEEWILWAQWRSSSSHYPIPCERIKASGREEQFSLRLPLCSAHPFMPFTGFQLLIIGLISSEVMELTSDRAQQTRGKASITLEDTH